MTGRRMRRGNLYLVPEVIHLSVTTRSQHASSMVIRSVLGASETADLASEPLNQGRDGTKVPPMGMHSELTESLDATMIAWGEKQTADGCSGSTIRQRWDIVERRADFHGEDPRGPHTPSRSPATGRLSRTGAPLAPNSRRKARVPRASRRSTAGSARVRSG